MDGRAPVKPLILLQCIVNGKNQIYLNNNYTDLLKSIK